MKYIKNLDNLPDCRDGFSKIERIVFYCLKQIQSERGGRNVPAPMLYGRVLEHINISEEQFQKILQKLMK